MHLACGHNYVYGVPTCPKSTGNIFYKKQIPQIKLIGNTYQNKAQGCMSNETELPF